MSVSIGIQKVIFSPVILEYAACPITKNLFFSSPQWLPDPNPSTRAVFTEVLINNPIPDHACEDWKNQVKSLKELYQLLANHPGMSRNNEQLFAQPAHEKNTVYFMWDFDRWVDVVSRSVMAANLLLDQPPGMLDQMVSMSYPNQSGEKPVIGNDIKDAARKLT
ncbi:hypothetical protein D0867_00600 [Hortaea werneckii]|uniref:Uncharacterized protein n=1 Tax=Hortaea werneckii TaxID=91943 RepID=A0A3M7ADW1_HORWE|nr:hypothetical protein D0867_00600 [Hortaea werneckii]